MSKKEINLVYTIQDTVLSAKVGFLMHFKVGLWNEIFYLIFSLIKD